MPITNFTFSPFLNLGEFVIALSRALDLANPRLADHAPRVAAIAHQIGSALELEENDLHTLLFSALLHDTGISSSEMKLQAADFDVGLNAQQHALEGGEFFSDLDMLDFTAPVITNHHIHWPNIRADQTDLASPQMLGNLIHLADRVEILLDRDQPVLLQKDAILEKIGKKREKVFAPVFVDTLFSHGRMESFWLNIESGRGTDTVRRFVLAHAMHMPLPQVRNLSSIFASIIDRKSSFTHRHSHGVAQIAAELATFLGYSPPETLRIEIAALLHDLGKLSIPDAILEKPESLTERERLLMNQHSFYTLHLLEGITYLNEIGRWAGYHHEKLDCSGYPFRLGSEGIPPEARILAVCDIYQALRESRPYRPPKASEEAFAILRTMAREGELDTDMVHALEKSALRWPETGPRD